MNKLQALLARRQVLISPGIWDSLSALLVEEAGFECVSISGAAVTAAQKGLPDKSFLNRTDLLQLLTQIRPIIQIPILVDCEDGYGTISNVIYTVQTMKIAGADCICLQDKDPWGRLYEQKEMVERLHAAKQELGTEDMLLMARTDSIAQNGLQDGLERAFSYQEAGADLLFLNGVSEDWELQEIQRAKFKLPLKFNNTIKANRRQRSAQELFNAGFQLVCYSASLQKASIKAIQEILVTLKETGCTQSFINKKVSQSERSQILNERLWNSYEKKYSIDQ